MLHLIKNPIVFGAIVGIVLCILLFCHDRFLTKKTDEKSKPITYVKIFFAGFVATAPLVFLFFNRNLSFKNPNAKSIESVIKDVVQDAGATAASTIDDLTQSSVEAATEAVKVEAVKPKKVKMKKCHADVPDW